MSDDDLIRRGDALAACEAYAPTAWTPLLNDAIAAIPAVTPDGYSQIDPASIEAANRRWHGEDHRVVAVRWEPYKPDGARQMKAKGRWQEQVGSGDFWRWSNCDRPQGLGESK